MEVGINSEACQVLMSCKPSVTSALYTSSPVCNVRVMHWFPASTSLLVLLFLFLTKTSVTVKYFAIFLPEVLRVTTGFGARAKRMLSEWRRPRRELTVSEDGQFLPK